MSKEKHNSYCGIGGQAVLEGVMMKNRERYAVSVRKPDGTIETKTDEYKGVWGDKKITKLPFVRGVFNFIDSMVLGMQTLTWSAEFFEEDEQAKPGKFEQFLTKVFGEKAEKVIMGMTIAFSIVMAVAIFMILPYWISSFFGGFVRNLTLLAVLEGVLRILIFLAYVVMISAMKDIRRVYMYHGAEHKCINCIENGRELNVHNVRNSSREHKRCGTSFLLFVMVVSVVLFMFIRVSDPVWRLLIRLLLIPVIAGISYELIRLAGRSDNPVIGLLSAPGLLLQKLTTKEPDDDMIEIAIASVEAVFDWRAYLKDNFGFVAPEASGSAAEGEAAASKNSAVSAEAVSEDGADK